MGLVGSDDEDGSTRCEGGVKRVLLRASRRMMRMSADVQKRNVERGERKGRGKRVPESCMVRGLRG